MPIVYLVPQTNNLIPPKALFRIGQIQSSLMWSIFSWLPRGGLTKSYMSTIPKLICMATPKNPWAEHTSFQTGIKHNNPSAHPILPRSMLVYLNPKETRRMPLQNLVSFLWINSNNPLTSINHYIIHLILQIQCLWCSTWSPEVHIIPKYLKGLPYYSQSTNSRYCDLANSKVKLIKIPK